MKEQPIIRVLWVEDDPDDYVLARSALTSAEGIAFDLTWVTTYEAALEALGCHMYDICLIDYRLGAYDGLELVREADALGIQAPMILLTGLEDEAVAMRAVGEGAQDYLVKGRISRSMLVRAIRYAIERHKQQAALRDLSLRDDLTGLYNRRGFFSLASQQLKLARRQRRVFLIMFADLDYLKWINDTFGHQAGSQALLDMAQVLKATFRESDIIARLGGDEFVVLIIDSGDSTIETIADRLQAHLRQHNAQADRSYALSISTGFVYYDPESTISLEEALVQADQAMYEHKRSKRAARGMAPLGEGQ